MGNRPSASIIVLSHRTEDGMVLEALQSAFDQTEPNVEVRLEHCPLYWRGKLNDAVNSTAGEVVTILCYDDLLHPEFTREGLDAIAHGDVVFFDRQDFEHGSEPRAGKVMRFVPQVPVGATALMTFHPGISVFGTALPMTMMIRRTLWDRLQGYDEAMPHADTELWHRIIEAGAKIIYVAKPYFRYRRHPDQMSKTAGSLIPAIRAFHRKHYDRFHIDIGDTPDAQGNLACQVHHA